MATRKPARLSADDWIDAGLDAIAEEGVTGLAVEPLAARLGATKGSFYWHFARRESLLDAVLARWEVEGTQAIIDAVAQVPPGLPQLQLLFALTSQPDRASRVEHALLAQGDDPRIAPVLRRVTTRRIDATTDLFAAMGYPPDEVRRRALLAYGWFLGYWQLHRTAPQELPAAPEEMDALSAFVLRALLVE